MSAEKDKQEQHHSNNGPVEGETRSRDLKSEEEPEDANNIYLTSNSTLQTPEEFKLDKETEHTDELIVSGGDDPVTDNDMESDTAMAGNAEAGDLDTTKLNQGLEEQGAQMTYDLDEPKNDQE